MQFVSLTISAIATQLEELKFIMREYGAQFVMIIQYMEMAVMPITMRPMSSAVCLALLTANQKMQLTLEEEVEKFGWMMSIVLVTRKVSLIAAIEDGALIIVITVRIWVLLVQEVSDRKLLVLVVEQNKALFGSLCRKNGT